MFTSLPSTVWIRVAHPTEQNGQMLGVVLASLMRSSCARAMAGASVTPSPTRPPIAVPAPALAVSCRKSRRLTCMESSPLEEWGWAGPDGCMICGWSRRAQPPVPDPIRLAYSGLAAGAWVLYCLRMLELPELTPEHFEILVMRELRKIGLDVSELRTHRRSMLPEPERGYLLELKGVVRGAGWQRRTLIACRRQQSPIGSVEVESLKQHLTEAEVEAGVLFGAAEFDPSALTAAEDSALALLRVTDGRTAFDTSGRCAGAIEIQPGRGSGFDLPHGCDQPRRSGRHPGAALRRTDSRHRRAGRPVGLEAARAPVVSIHELGTLGGAVSQAKAVNRAGQVVGTSRDALVGPGRFS